MRNNETGEFELVVGNRQLLSGFFIVVLLFAVAFAMGYIVGRNSAPSAKLPNETASSSGAASQMPEARPQPVAQAPATGGVPTRRPQGALRRPMPQRAPHAGRRPPTLLRNLPRSPNARRAQAQASTPAPPAAPPPQGPEGTPEAAPGAYWQVLATASQTSADAMRQTMKDKGFPVSLQPGPNSLIRVLIGPYDDKQALGRAKTELENAGVHPVLNLK